MSAFPDSFDHLPGDDSHPVGSAHNSFDGDLNSFSDPVEDLAADNDFFGNHQQHSSFDSTNNDIFRAAAAEEVPAEGNFSVYSSEVNGNGAENGVFLDSDDGPILPPPSEMREEGAALREWRRENAALLAEKEQKEKEVLSQIIQEAEEYKAAFYEKRKATCENNKTTNREKEKLFLADQEKFHKEADANYWKSISELIPNEVAAIQRRGKKKEQEKKPSIVVVQGPKPGKPTDLSRMRQILIKLKHETPSHLKLSPPPAKPAKDSKSTSTDDSPAKAPVASTSEAVVAA